jgi:hypothetical protein
MPGGLDALIRETLANVARAEAVAKLDEPPEVKVRSVKIRWFIPGHTVVFQC